MLIAVVGSAGSGKGTVGDSLSIQEGFQKFAFADGVKDVTASIFGWPRAFLEGDTKASRHFRELKDDFWSEKFGFEVTPRWALQKVGTEGGRDALHSDVWVHRCLRSVQQSGVENAVITDTRFPNEIDAVLAVPGAEVWFVSKTVDICWSPNISDAAYDWCRSLRDGALLTDRIVELDPKIVEYATQQTGLHRSEWDWFRHPEIAKIGTPRQSNRIRHIVNSGTIDDLIRTVAEARMESK